MLSDHSRTYDLIRGDEGPAGSWGLQCDTLPRMRANAERRALESLPTGGGGTAKFASCAVASAAAMVDRMSGWGLRLKSLMMPSSLRYTRDRK